MSSARPLLLLLLGVATAAGAAILWRHIQTARGYGSGLGDGSVFLPSIITGVDVSTPETVAPTPATAPRGIRNNNPGNIRLTSDTWIGQSAQQTDSSFVVFTEPLYGLRALCKILLKYQRSYDALSVQDIIGRWAPASENNTNAYVANVASELGVSPSAALDLSGSLRTLAAFARAIVSHENGSHWADYYSAALYAQAAKMAASA